jgi:hypothetical protein
MNYEFGVSISDRLRTKRTRVECVSWRGWRKGTRKPCKQCARYARSHFRVLHREQSKSIYCIQSRLIFNRIKASSITQRVEHKYILRSFLVSSFVHEGASIVGEDRVKLFQHPWNCVHRQRHLIYELYLDGYQLAKETLLTRYVLCEDSLV